MPESIEFIALIRRNDEGEFISSFPDFPGSAAVSPSEDAAIDKAAETLADRIEELRQSGEAIPAASTFIDVMKRFDAHGLLAIRVRPGERTVNRPSG
jgi:predicted RNase H-like HicB family nuclease